MIDRLTTKCLLFLCDHLEILQWKLKFQFFGNGLYVWLFWHESLSCCALLEPPVVIDFLDNAEHLGDFLSGHLESIFQEKLLHLVHTNGIATISIKLVEHLSDLLGSLDFSSSAIVSILEVGLFRRGAGKVFQPVHDYLSLEETSSLWRQSELLWHGLRLLCPC